MAVIAVDFDGTCVPSLPESGRCIDNIDTGAVGVLKLLVSKGHKIVLWTCRNHSFDNPYNYDSKGYLRVEDSLDEAENWFKKNGIPLYGVNNTPECEELIGKSRKLLYDILIDDTNIGIELSYGEVEYVSYSTGEIKTINTYCVNWEWVYEVLKNQGYI